MKFKYYIIHNCDEERKVRMEEQLKRVNIPKEDTVWMNHPNRDELTPEIISSFVDANSIYKMKPGQISCTYKHYLSMQQFLTTDADVCVIIEDNNHILNDVPCKMQEYLQELESQEAGWDVCFDYGIDCCPYIESPLTPNKLIYPKSNAYPGSSRCASFYFMNRAFVEKLVKHFVPVRITIDWWLNELFRTTNARVYWVEPSNVIVWPHASTSIL